MRVQSAQHKAEAAASLAGADAERIASVNAAYRSVFSFCLMTPWSEEGGSRSLVVRSCRQKSRHPLLALAFLESHLPKLDVAVSESCVLHQSFTDRFGFEVRVRNRCPKRNLGRQS